MKNKNIPYGKEIIDRLEEVQKTQRDLINRVEGVENILKGVLSQLKPEGDRVINLTEILRYPNDYGFEFSEGKTLLELIQEKGKYENLRKEMGLTLEDCQDLTEDLYLPDNDVSEKIFKMLDVSWSDFILAKARNYSIIRNSPEELLKPYLELDTLDLLEESKKKSISGQIFGFVMNLFVRNNGRNLLSGNPEDYEKKNEEEIKRILELRDSVYLVEYPTEWKSYSDPKTIKFRLSPENILHAFRMHGSSIFARIKMEDVPMFYKVDWDIWELNKWAVRDLTEKKHFLLTNDKFLQVWGNTGFEFVAFTKSIDRIIGEIADDIVTEEELWHDIRQKKPSSFFFIEKDVAYMLFKSKWIDQEEYKGKSKKSIDYVVEPELRR